MRRWVRRGFWFLAALSPVVLTVDHQLCRRRDRVGHD
jgi:hypothetical protein